MFMSFFFQAEDGIRDGHVTGVQTCALPIYLSGGERQRVAIAKAMYANPSIILADEPTASLDSDRAFEVMDMLQEATTESEKTTIVVTHDTRLIDYCDKVYEMTDGSLEQKQ